MATVSSPDTLLCFLGTADSVGELSTIDILLVLLDLPIFFIMENTNGVGMCKESDRKGRINVGSAEGFNKRLESAQRNLMLTKKKHTSIYFATCAHVLHSLPEPHCPKYL